MAKKLSPKQERFVSEYLVDLNATQAATRAGYSEKTAKSIGSRLLTNVDVAAAISKARWSLERRTEITQERVLEELAKIGFANMEDYIRVTPDGDPYLDLSEMTRDQASAIQEVTVEDAPNVRRVKCKLYDKQTALRLIGKHLGMFIERLEHTGKDGGPIEVADARESLARRIAGIASRAGEGEADPPASAEGS